jgi:hypothetical protein
VHWRPGENGDWSSIDIRNLVANARTNARMNIAKSEVELFANLNL